MSIRPCSLSCTNTYIDIYIINVTEAYMYEVYTPVFVSSSAKTLLENREVKMRKRYKKLDNGRIRTYEAEAMGFCGNSSPTH